MRARVRVRGRVRVMVRARATGYSNPSVLPTALSLRLILTP